MQRAAYVIIHGFGGTPKDILSIKEQLKLNNIDEQDIFTPLMLGHHKKGVIDIGTKFEDIVINLKGYIELNCSQYEKIVVIGYSMGGLISMALALDTKIDALILLNAPMHIWAFKNFLWTCLVSNIDKKIYHIKTVLSSINYNKIINSIELKRMQKYVKENLIKITAHTYIVQSMHDYVAKPMSANEIYNNIGAKEKKICWYENTSHFMPDEDCIGEVIESAIYWIRQLETIKSNTF